MTISDEEEQGKAGIGRIPADVLIVLIIVLATSLAFGLGVLAGKDMGKAEGKDGFWIEQLEVPLEGGGGPAAVLEATRPAAATKPVPETPKAAEVQTYVASKNGTKYYLPTCGTAKRIKEENRVWFATKAEAEAAGYGAAANCPGL